MNIATTNSSNHTENNCSQPEKNGASTIVSNSTYDEIPDAQDYEDIDEIYDYVRGIKPPPTRAVNADSGNKVSSINNDRNTKEPALQLDLSKASQYQKNKAGQNKLSHINNSKLNGRVASHHHHIHNLPNHDKLSGVPTSPTTIVTITTPPGHNEPDLIVGSVPPPPVPKHRVPYGRLLSSKSLDRLDASDSEYDEPPPPPPIETIPSKQNLFFLNPPGGVSVSVSNKNSKNLTKSDSDNFTTHRGENETGLTNEIHNNGGSVQIQIRSTDSNPQTQKLKSNNPSQYGYSSGCNAGMIITSNSTTKDNGQHTHNASHGHHSHHNSYPYSLGSTGNSINTTPTNTSGSGGSYGSSSSGDKKGKPKQHLYVKHNSNNSSSNQNHCNSPLGGGGGLLAADFNGKGLSGSPANRIVFRRSPIFDCRYKSMNDLNRNSLESGVSASGAVGACSQRHRCFPHGSNHHGFNVSVSNVNSVRDSTPSGLNLNLNLLNLNMNLKASAKGKGIFRPKSLTNLVFNDDAYHGAGSNVFGGGGGGALVGGVKKKLTDMVVPSHHHAAHTPPPPPVEILQKVPLKCSRARKTSTPQTPTMYL